MDSADRNIHRTQALKSILGSQRAFSVEEFCQRFGVGRTKVYEELKLGRLRARKIGRRTIIAEDDAEDWSRSLPIMNATEVVS
jgi:excisionase family DNA binding protein